jgi:hypothetical protein
MASETWSAILSGWPSVTDSEVKVRSAPHRFDSVEDCPGDAPLAGQRDIFVDAVGPDDHDGVRVVPEPDTRGRNVVGDDQVDPFAHQLGPRVRHHVGGLRGEADQHLAGPPPGPEAGEDVGGRLEHDVGRAPLLLDLVVGDGLRPEVGDGRGHHDHVGLLGGGGHGRLHLRRALDPHDLGAGRAGQVGGRDEDDVRAAGHGLVGDGVALLARRPVAQVADGVERLAGAAGGDHDAHAGEGPGGERGLDGGDDHGRGGEAAGPHVAAGQPAGLGRHHDHAPPAQHGQVVLHGRVLPHLGVHGRRDDHRRPGGEQGGGQQVRGDAGRVRAEQAGAGRGDHDGVGRLPEAGVRDRVGPVPERGLRRLGGQRVERGRADEAGGRAGQDRGDVGPGVDEAPAHLHRLVGGDPAGDAEDDPAAGQHGVAPTRRRRPRRRSTARPARPPRSAGT